MRAQPDSIPRQVVDRPCQVRERLTTRLEVASVLFGLAVPTVLGPLAASVAHIVLNIIEPLMDVTKWKPVKEDDMRKYFNIKCNIIFDNL